MICSTSGSVQAPRNSCASPFCVKGTDCGRAASITGTNYVIDGGLIKTSQAPGSRYSTPAAMRPSR